MGGTGAQWVMLCRNNKSEEELDCTACSLCSLKYLLFVLRTDFEVSLCYFTLTGVINYTVYVQGPEFFLAGGVGAGLSNNKIFTPK